MRDLVKASIDLGFSSASIEVDGSDFKVENRKPTASEMTAINSKAKELETEFNSLEWSRNRQAEYAKKSPVEQIEMMDDGTFKAWYAGIKTANPKT